MPIFSDLTQVMQNARTDAKTLDEYVHGAADTQVTSRLNKRYWTLATLDNKLSLVKVKAEKTLADIDTLAVSASDAITAKSNSANTTIDNKAAQASSDITAKSNSANTTIDNKVAQANSDIAAKVASANTAIDSKVAAIDARADNEIANLQSAINAAAAAGAGANGWISDLIAEDGLTQRVINALNIRCVESVTDLASIKTPRDGQIVFVKSYYAKQNKGAHHRIYRSSKSIENNGTTVINGWEIYFSNAKYISTDMVGLQSGQSCALQIRDCMEHLNSKGGGTLNIEDGDYLCEAQHLVKDPVVGRSEYRCWFPIYSNMLIQGSKKAVLKAEDNIIELDKDNIWAKGYQFFVDTFDWNPRTNVTIKGITLDANGQNNKVPRLNDKGNQALVNFVAIRNTSNAIIEDMTFKNNPGHQPIVVEQDCRNFILRNCTFNEMGMGGVNGWNTHLTDHSTLYIVADGYLIQNNRFVNSQYTSLGTAIELHGQNGWVTGNYVENYSCTFILAAMEMDSININICENTIVNTGVVVSLWTVENYRLETRFINNNITISQKDLYTVIVGSFNTIPVTATGRVDCLMQGNTIKGNTKTILGELGRLDTFVSKGNTFYDMGESGYVLPRSSNSKNAYYEINDSFVNCKTKFLLGIVEINLWDSSSENLLMKYEKLKVNIDCVFTRHQSELEVITSAPDVVRNADGVNINLKYGAQPDSVTVHGFMKIYSDNKVVPYGGSWNISTFTFDIKALDVVKFDGGYAPNIQGKLTKLDGTYYEKFADKNTFLSRRYDSNMPTVSQKPKDLIGDIVYNTSPVNCMGWVCTNDSPSENTLGTWKPFGQITQ